MTNGKLSGEAISAIIALVMLIYTFFIDWPKIIKRIQGRDTSENHLKKIEADKDSEIDSTKNESEIGITVSDSDKNHHVPIIPVLFLFLSVPLILFIYTYLASYFLLNTNLGYLAICPLMLIILLLLTVMFIIYSFLERH